jgi:hypothetical protein
MKFQLSCKFYSSALQYSRVAAVDSTQDTPLQIFLDIAQCRTGKIYRRLRKKFGRDDAVGIATRYGLDGPGFEPRWKKDFSLPIQTGPEAPSVSYTRGTESPSQG